MKKPTSLFLAAAILAVISTNLRAQSKTAELSDIVDKLSRSVDEQLPGWTHQSVTPIEGSKNVIIEQWNCAAKTVRVVIISHSSSEEAIEKTRGFVVDMKATPDVPDVGDEGYSWGTNASIVFRKRHLTVNVNAQGDDLKDEKKLSKQFARLVADAISAP